MRLYEKLKRFADDPAWPGFAICDAKDCDMGAGITTFGPKRDAAGRATGKYKTRADFMQAIREIVRQDIVDMMILSVSNLERALAEGIFEGSAITLAARANDTTDVWMGIRHGTYTSQASRPFRTPAIEHILRGSLDPAAPNRLTDLALYSVTFVNDIDRDFATLAAYRAFRLEAEQSGLRHFLEVFNPNVGMHTIERAEVGRYVNDCILGTLAAVPRAGRPLFLKVAFNGPAVLEELAGYDPCLIIGILGGSAGTTRDTLELVRAVQRYGARLVMFGRKIRLAEDPPSIVELMRRVADHQVSSIEAVKIYHDRLQKAGVAAVRPLEEDLQLTDPVLQTCASTT